MCEERRKKKKGEGHKDDSHYQVTTTQRRGGKKKETLRFFIKKKKRGNFTDLTNCNATGHTDGMVYSVNRKQETIYKPVNTSRKRERGGKKS